MNVPCTFRIFLYMAMVQNQMMAQLARGVAEEYTDFIKAER